jgi:hypothetical protein
MKGEVAPMLYIQENWNGDCPNGKELDQKDKNTLPSHTSSVDDSPSPCLSFFSPNYQC